MEMPDGGLVYGALSGLAALASVILTARRGPRGDQEPERPPAAPIPPAPEQPDGTWQVSPEMYRWFQQEMGTLHTRVSGLEDSEREQRARADKHERLLGLALTHIEAQDHQMAAAGISTVPMSPELVAARDSRP